MDSPRLNAHLAEIRAQGFTIVRDALEPELVDALNEALDDLEKRYEVKPAGNDFEGDHTIRIYNLLARQPVFERVPVHENLLPVIEGVLDDGCLISSLSSISIDPGETPQPIHADDQLLNMPKPHPALVCNSMLALTDFTEANGATRLVAESHLRDHSPTYGQTYDSIAAEMPKGSILIWHGSLWHGGGANRSSARRVGIAMNYCAGFIRQQENQQLGIPLERVRAFPRRLQELCGFGTYRQLIGHIDKGTPIQRVLEDNDGFSTVWDKLPTKSR